MSDIFDFFHETFGMSKEQFNVSDEGYNESPPERNGLFDKIIDCMYGWKETKDKKHLMKAKYFIERLLKEK